jgi:hypothetical protein
MVLCRFLEKQLEFACEVNLPVILHEREAFSDMVSVLEKFRSRGLRGSVNCFSGTASELKTYLEFGFHIGVTGLIGNDNRVGENFLDVVKQIPLDRMMLSSDAPYLTPFNMPKPYPKNNLPNTLGYVALKLEELLNIKVEEIATITTKNARNLFSLPVPSPLEFSEEMTKFNANVRVPYNSDKKELLFATSNPDFVPEPVNEKPKPKKRPAKSGNKNKPAANRPRANRPKRPVARR